MSLVCADDSLFKTGRLTAANALRTAIAHASPAKTSPSNTDRTEEVQENSASVGLSHGDSSAEMENIVTPLDGTPDKTSGLPDSSKVSPTSQTGSTHNFEKPDGKVRSPTGSLGQDILRTSELGDLFSVSDD